MSSADQIRLSLQRSVRRFKSPPPTFSDDERDGIQTIFSEISEEYPGNGYEIAKQRVMAALLEFSHLYEHLVVSWLIDGGLDRHIFGRICRDLIDEGLPVKMYQVDVYGRRGFERNALVLERM